MNTSSNVSYSVWWGPNSTNVTVHPLPILVSTLTVAYGVPQRDPRIFATQWPADALVVTPLVVPKH